MNKRRIWVWLVMGALLLAGFSIGYFFRKSSEPEREVISVEQAMEVYEEFPVSAVSSIKLSLVNENVRVLLSDNRYVRIVYQPSTDGLTFKYSLDNGLLSLTVGEVAGSGSLIPSAREMIYLYLPKGSRINVNVLTESGFVDLDNVSAKALNVTTGTGLVNLSDCDLSGPSVISTGSGKIFQRDTAFTTLNITSASGSVAVRLPEALSAVSHQISGSAVYLNGEAVGSQLSEAIAGSPADLGIAATSGLVRIRDLSGQ